MNDTDLTKFAADEELAVNNPQAYLVSNPTPRDWNLSAQDIARSVKIDPYLAVAATKEDIEGPRKLSWIESVGKGIAEGISSSPIKESSENRLFYSSPNMTQEEAERLMQDVLFANHKHRQLKAEETARQVKYKDTYEFSNAVGYALKMAFLGLTTGATGAGIVAGAEAASEMELDLVDRYVTQTGSTEGYTKKDVWKDTGLASAYGVFIGATEGMLGIEPLAAGAVEKYIGIEALARLARMKGQLTKSAILKGARRFGTAGIEEGVEELIQNPVEDLTIAVAGYADQLSANESLKKAWKSTMFAVPIGGTLGWGFYRYNRKSIINSLSKWNEENEIGLNDQQIVEMTDEMLDNGRKRILDQVSTSLEIQNHYGQAYNLVKQRITEQIDATGTTPWADQNKSKDDYIKTLADSITIPAINVANALNIPLSEFLEIADINTATIAGNVAWLRPITSVEDINKIIAEQDAVIAEEKEAKKLGVGNEDRAKRARTRKAIAERVRRELLGELAIRNARQTRRKENADYVTAKDLQPEQINTLETATQAQPGEDAVLFGGIRIPVQYQVVELNTIQPSHINGQVNPNYTNTELQNRASRGTTQDVADLREKATNITPERLMRASTAAEGAPVVNEKGEVIAGNGRAEIIRFAYENPESAEKYKQELINQGFNIEGMQQPVLVRRNTTMTDQEQIAAADISNISETSAFDNASQARRDTQYLKDSKTPTEFASKLPISERRGLMQNNGKWNKRKVQQRYEDALLAWLCGNDTQLFENLVLDRGLSQKIIDILTANGAQIYDTATKYPATELREDIYHALVKMQRTTRDNFLEVTQQLELDGHDVMPENIMIWNWLFTDSTTNRQFLQSYATTLANNQENVRTGEDLLGQKVAPLSKKDALIQALKKADQAKGETAAARGKEYVALFDENEKVTDPNLAAAIASYNNQFAPQVDGQLYKLAFISGTTFYQRPSTEYVLRGGEGQIVHGWGIYAQKDQYKNVKYYRDKFARQKVFVRNMPDTTEEFEQISLEDGTKLPKIENTLSDKENIELVQTLITLGIPNLAEVNPDTKASAFSLNAALQTMAQQMDKNSATYKELTNDVNFLTNDLINNIQDQPIKDLEAKIKDLSFFFKDAIDTAVKTFHVKTKDIAAGSIRFTIDEYLTDNDSLKTNLLTNEVLKQVVPGKSDKFYDALENKIFMGISGINPLRKSAAAFDNTIFKDTEAIVLSDYDFGLFQKTINTLSDTINDEPYTSIPVDKIVQNNPMYGGFLGLFALSRQFGHVEPESVLRAIAAGRITFENMEDDTYYKQLKERAELTKDKVNESGFVISVFERAKKMYTKQDGAADVKTWAAISQAFRTLTKPQQKQLREILAEEDVQDKDADLLIEVLQNPHNIKRTRGQQLAIEVPEAKELLNEDVVLADQPSANLTRQILEDFMPGGFVSAFINETNAKAWPFFAKKHNIKEVDDIREFSERVFEQNLSYENDEQRTQAEKDTALLTDYIMANMTGEGLYRALMDIVPEAYIELNSGETIGEEKDYESIPEKHKTIMGVEDVPPELARDVSKYLSENMGIKGIQYEGGRDEEGYVVFSDEAVEVLDRMDDDQPMYYQKRGVIRGQYDPELQAILLTKYWNETTLVHEYHHRYLEKLWGYFKQAQTGERAMPEEFMADLNKLFQMLDINPAQDQLTVVQQEKFATMVEAYLTGLGVDAPENIAFQSFLHWIPEQYKSIMDLAYLDENGEIQNPLLDQESIDWFNKWFACPFAPSLASAPDAQRIVNPTDDKGTIVPSSQKIMNNREKEWGQDSEEQNKADAQLWRAINENTPNDMRAALDGEKELMKAEAKNLPDDTKLPEEQKQTLRDKWFKTRIPDARERAANMAREYLAKNPEHAKELAFADPETLAEFDAPVDQGMLIRAVMETVPHGSDEWYILNDNLATVKSMSGSTLSLSGDTSHQAYLDAKREVEAARELKAAVNYAGTRWGAMDKWNSDIRAFIAKNTDAILATAPDSIERKTAIKAFLEEAKTKFSANTTNAVLNQMDLTGIKTKNSQAFVKWAEKQIKQAAHAKIDTAEQKELIKASIAAQLALKDIDSTEEKDGKYTRAVQSAKDIRHWQFVKDKMKKAYIGRWGKFGIFWDNLFGSYAPSAMLMSVNTLFFANVPSTAINTGTIRLSALTIGKNNVDEKTQKGEIKRIKQIFNASGVNLAQMDKPTSPSTLHGEKYTKSEQTHWYDFTFEILGRTDNEFRVPTFVDALARIATKNAGGDKTKATTLFKEYAKLNNQSDEAKIARKQALAIANMAVFTQDGTLATGLNQIRTVLNTISRVPVGLDPNGFGLGNILAPFLKTGANITEMGISASLAPIRTLAAGFQKLQGKEIPDIKKLALTSDWINLAWTSAIIALMAAISGDDDDWYTEPYESGRTYDPNKPYDSIRFGNTWVKMDIFGPIAIPLRTAAMLIKDWEDKKLASIADGMYEALSDTPLVQQFTDSSLDYMNRKPGAYWSSFGYNQANKLVPAQAKTLTKAISRGTGATLDTQWAGKTIDRKFHRNYGLDGERLTTNDLINIFTNRLKYTEE